MAYSFTVGGYTFTNPPEEYRKLARLGNNPQPSVGKEATDFYQSDSQDLQFQVDGTLALDPPLGEDSDDLDELERLQQIAIEGGEVAVEFDPFFSGTCIIEDDPLSQSEGESDYSFTFTVNSESTDDSAYPSRSPPGTGNTFELGSLNLGYDPDTVRENYERQTARVRRLQGVARSVDNAGLIPKIRVSGMIDGAGQAELWNKARNNVMAYLSAEFQKGWCLIDTLSIRNSQQAPDYLDGLFQYDLDVLIVKDPASGIGSVSSYVDQEIRRTGTYAGDPGSGGSSFTDLDFTVEGGTGSLGGDYLEWNETTVTVITNSTNYVFVDDGNNDGYGTVKVNQSGFPADALGLYRVETDGSQITKVVDVRAILLQDREREEGGSDSDSKGGDAYFTVFTGGYDMNDDGQESEWDTTSLLLASSDRNYVWAEDDNNDQVAQVNTATSGYPSSGNFVKLWRVDTDADSVTNKIDDRPADMGNTGSNTGDADLNFSEDLRLTDGQIDFEHLLRLVDSMSVGDAGMLPALGLLDLTDTITAPDDTGISPTGIAPLTDQVILDDGGSGTSTGGGSVDETITWESDSDWDGAVSERHVEHPGSSISLVPIDGFEDLSDGDSVPSAWNPANASITDEFAIDTYSIDNNSNGDPVLSSTVISGESPDQVTFGYRETTDSQGLAFFAYDTSGNRIFAVGSSNPNVESTGTGTVKSNFQQDYDTFRKFTITFDWQNNQFDLLWEDITGPNSDASESGIGFDNSAGSIGEVALGSYTWPNGGGGTVNGNEWVDEFYGAYGSGELLTATKSFSTGGKPDLEALDYSLNGHAATLDVIGSPGAAGEEVQSVTLDGSTSYSLTWASDHTDFHIRVNMSSSDRTGTPDVNSLSLNISTSSGGDADQNKNTTWEIQGAKHDTSGNEYEGGGVVSKYGAD